MARPTPDLVGGSHETQEEQALLGVPAGAAKAGSAVPSGFPRGDLARHGHAADLRRPSTARCPHGLRWCLVFRPRSTSQGDAPLVRVTSGAMPPLLMEVSGAYS